MRVRVRIDDARTRAELRDARRDINLRLRTGLQKAAEGTVLPRARSMAPHIVSPFLVAKATSRRAYITTLGPRRYDRIAGLLEFGGVVSTEILPKRAFALTTPEGPRARVAGKRRYRPRGDIRRAVEQSVPRMEDVQLREMMRAFDGLPHQP